MKIEQLKQAILIAELKSITLAAESLFLSQPNLSLSIKKLEDELGYPIFIRNSKGVELTARGRKLIDYSKTIVLLYDQINNIGHSEDSLNRITLTIGNSHLFYVNHAVSIFYEKYAENDMRVEIYEGIREEIEDLVINRTIEIGIINIYSLHRRLVLRRLNAKGLQYFRLGSADLHIIIGEGNPLYNSPHTDISVNELRDFPLLIYDELELDPFASVVDSLNLRQKQRFVVTERATMFDLLEKTNAFSISGINPVISRNTDYNKKIRFLRLKDNPISEEIGWIIRSDVQPLPAALSFIEILSQLFA